MALGVGGLHFRGCHGRGGGCLLLRPQIMISLGLGVWPDRDGLEVNEDGAVDRVLVHEDDVVVGLRKDGIVVCRNQCSA